MGEHRRKADGRRVFSTEFKRTTVQRILSGEKTLAELSRELDISRSVIRNWKRCAEAGATTTVQARGRGARQPFAGGLRQDPGPRAGAGSQDHGGRDPARGPGDRKKAVVAQRVRAVTRHSMSAICSVLGIARRTAYYVVRARAGGRHHRAHDDTVLQQIRAVTNSRATHGYRRVWAMVNRTFRTGYNRKRIRRVMQLHGLLLALRAPAPWPPALRPDPAAGIEPALVPGCFPDSLLERRGGVGRLRDRLS